MELPSKVHSLLVIGGHEDSLTLCAFYPNGCGRLRSALAACSYQGKPLGEEIWSTIFSLVQ